MNTRPDEPEGSARIAALVQGLQKLGWTDGRNVSIEIRWAADDADLYHRYATELLASDVVVASATPSVAALQQVTLLKELAPNARRLAVIRDTSIAGIGQFAVIQSIASSLGVELNPIAVRDAREIEQAVTAFARSTSGGLIVTASSFTPSSRSDLRACGSLPFACSLPIRFYAAGGGLASYGPDLVENFTRAASYIDRILKGEKPADLPVQAPTKYALVTNFKTAKAISLNIPPALQSGSQLPMRPATGTIRPARPVCARSGRGLGT